MNVETVAPLSQKTAYKYRITPSYFLHNKISLLYSSISHFQTLRSKENGREDIHRRIENQGERISFVQGFGVRVFGSHPKSHHIREEHRDRPRGHLRPRMRHPDELPRGYAFTLVDRKLYVRLINHFDACIILLQVHTSSTSRTE